MPCNHKFQNQLDLTKLDFEPMTLIVGTFNPAWPESNTSEWFYGKTASNFFWDVVPRLYGEASLINHTPGRWKQFCRDKQIAISDLISSIDDADPNSPEHAKMLGGLSDKAIEHNFEDFDFVNIAQVLKSRPSIKNVYFTRGVTEAFWRYIWNPVMHYCSANKIHERRLLPPSYDASYQYEVYNNEHADNKISKLEDYVLMRWQQEWHF